MQQIINFSEETFFGVVFNDGTFFFRENQFTLKPKKFQKCDAFQKVIEAYIVNPFFPWLCITLLLSKKKWKKPINIILILHWFLRATGDLLRNTMQLRPKDGDKRWPFSNKNWLISNAIAHLFWLTGEMVGDWYPLLRTKAVVNNSKKMIPVYITCILYNLIKIFGIASFFIDYPIDLRKVDENFSAIHDIYKFNICWWSAVCATNIMSCLYDISVINALRSCLFNQLKQYRLHKVNPILEKFKRISELRIIFSMLAAFLFLPFAIYFTSLVIYEFKNNAYNKFITSDSEIEHFRGIVLNFNYTLMYIDQILLRRYVDNNEKNVNTVIMKTFDSSRYLEKLSQDTTKSMDLDSCSTSYYNPLMVRSKSHHSQSYSQSYSHYFPQNRSLIHPTHNNSISNSLESTTYMYTPPSSLELGEPPYDWLDYSKLDPTEYKNNGINIASIGNNQNNNKNSVNFNNNNQSNNNSNNDDDNINNVNNNNDDDNINNVNNNNDDDNNNSNNNNNNNNNNYKYNNLNYNNLKYNNFNYNNYKYNNSFSDLTRKD